MNQVTLLLLIDLIDLAYVAATAGVSAFANYEAHSAKVRQMIVEGRDPTPEELAELSNTTKLLQARLNSDD
jgi:hypothetical protein